MTRTANTSTTAQRLARAEDLEREAQHLDALLSAARMVSAHAAALNRERASWYRAEAKALREKADG